MKADFVNPFLLSLLNVLSTMAQMELKPGAPKRKTDELARGDVSGLVVQSVRIAGPVSARRPGSETPLGGGFGLGKVFPSRD